MTSIIYVTCDPPASGMIMRSSASALEYLQALKNIWSAVNDFQNLQIIRRKCRKWEPWRMIQRKRYRECVMRKHKRRIANGWRKKSKNFFLFSIQENYNLISLCHKTTAFKSCPNNENKDTPCHWWYIRFCNKLDKVSFKWRGHKIVDHIGYSP